MKLSELKTEILENTLSNEFMIFLCSSDYFMAEQYVNEICSIKQRDIKYISSLKQSNNSFELFDTSDTMKVYKVDEYADFIEDFSEYNNHIVLCKKINNKVKESVEPYVVEFKEPEEWQTIEYIKTVCNGLDDDDAKWLYEVTNKKLYRIENEISKICMFDKEQQKEILNHFKFDRETDLYKIDNLILGDLITNRDLVGVYDYLFHSEACKIDSIGIAGTLIKKLKNMLLVGYGNVTANSIGISSGYFNYLKHNITRSENFLNQAIDFLTSIDCKMKKGSVDLPEQLRVDYIICKLLSFGK